MKAVASTGPSAAGRALVLAVEIALAVCYGVLAHLASVRDSHPLALAALLALVLLLLAAPMAARRAWAWLALPLLGAAAWALYRAGHAPLPLLLVPAAFVCLVAWMFGHTLGPGKVPLITRMVSVLDGIVPERMEPGLAAYTRGLTRSWAVLLLLLAALNLVLAMIASPDGVLIRLGLDPPVTITRSQWSWFANLLNYGIIAAFFIVEFELRKRRFPERGTSFASFLRQLGGLGPAFWRDQLR